MESDIFIKNKNDSNMKFKYTIKPFVVNSIDVVSIINDIIKSMEISVRQESKL